MIMYWVSLLAISILLYVLLDGFDLGIGILFGLTRDEARRHAMWGAVAPIWDGNETWLVVTAVILWGAFPAVYAMLLPAFYLPLVVMLSALILRGVAFEFRYKAERMRWIWDFSFFGGSLVATVKAAAYRQVPYLSIGLLIFLVIVFSFALAENLQIMHRWIERPYLFIFPAIAALAAIVLAVSVERHRDGLPFYMVALIFLSAFGTLAISFWPYMIPYVITVEEAAAPHSSLAFMFWGEGIFVYPLMLIYTVISYRVFRGKVHATPGH